MGRAARVREETNQAPVGFAIIARNAEKTLGACLDSLRPYVAQIVVAIDEMTTDRTAQIAKQHGADTVQKIKVSDWHECPVHGRVLAQHFAQARARSFAMLDKSLPFHGWIDADDVLVGGEKLKQLLESLHPDIAGVWAPYNYAQAGKDGPPSTLFDRERIVRSNLPWQWQYRVHEILTPVGIPTEHVNWTRTDQIVVKHQGEGHDTQGSARRNILLLEIDLEENPEDMRALFYLGNQYFALAEWEAAAHFYELSTKSDNPYQLWQALNYLSMAYEKMGLLEESEFAAFRALRVQPMHAEPWYRLASCAMLQGDAGRTEFWTHLGDNMRPVPGFVFRNPLDGPYNARLTLATAYANDGQTSKAKRELQRAAQAIPSKEVLEGIKYHQQIEEDSKDADAYVRVFQGLPEREMLDRTSLPVPENVWRFGRVRDLIVPAMLKGRPQTQPRIVFFCGRSVEPWAPPSLNTTGIGGSETAVIQIARRFAADGWRVDVYNDCDKYEGVYEDVGYWDCKRLREGESSEFFISWRNPTVYSLPLNRRVSLLWCHDLNVGANAGGELSRWQKVLGVSRWHSDYLSLVYSATNTAYAPNGIDLGRFPAKVQKIPFRCVYASSPDRGLLNVLRMWPDIAASEPAAELHVAYGWETIDKSIAHGFDPRGQLAALKQEVMALVEKTPGVVWRGRLPQDELAKLYQESYALLYPTSFTEVSCITAMEAMAGGCVPVTSEAGALPETIGDGGLIVKGNTYSQAWKEFYVNCARAVLTAPDVRLPLMKKGRERAKQLSWDASFQEHWKPLVTGLLEGEKQKELVTV